jgi:SAM-dependent methyltransferase
VDPPGLLPTDRDQPILSILVATTDPSRYILIEGVAANRLLEDRMDFLADSQSLYDENRLLPQHQAALTVIQGLVDDPNVTELRWLDLACGRGQMIASLDDILSAKARAKIIYYAYDIQADFLVQAERKGNSLGLKQVHCEVGSLSTFSSRYPPELHFDFITLTNTIHEVTPTLLAELLFDCVARLASNGCLFVYDMERLPSPELGAIPWKRGEISEIINTLSESIGAGNYQPEVGQWHHKTCNGWNLQIRRVHFGIGLEGLNGKRQEVTDATGRRIRQLLNRKKEECRISLESITTYRPETEEEDAQKTELLYNFWALTRATEKEQ